MGQLVSDFHLGRLAEEASHRHPDHDALFFEGRWHRSSELADRSRRLASGFRSLGIVPGARVVVLMANCPEVGITYSALWRVGAVVTPVVFLVSDDELRHVLTHSEAVAVVTTPEFVMKVKGAANGVTTLRHVLVVGESSYAELEAADPLVEVVDRADDDLAALMYTGGTTGRAKGVMLTHRNLWSCARSAHEASYVPGLTGGIAALPLSHAFGLIVSVIALHSPEPGRSVMMRWFEPETWLALSAEHRMPRGACVPAMVQLLLQQPLESYDLSAMRYISVGASPLAPELAHEFERRVPGVELLEGYGCTESGGVISTNPPSRRKLGTVGAPIPGYDVRVVDDDDNPLPAGSDGEIVVRADGVMAGYWRDEETTAATLRDGWLHTGDIGRFDSDGYLSVVDRKKDLIIRGGFNVYPRDVEDVLLSHPAVASVGVVGRPDTESGEEVVAFVSLRPGARVELHELRDFAREHLAAYKYPRDIHVVDAIPHTSVGKVDRKALRSLAVTQ